MAATACCILRKHKCSLMHSVIRMLLLLSTTRRGMSCAQHSPCPFCLLASFWEACWQHKYLFFVCILQHFKSTIFLCPPSLAHFKKKKKNTLSFQSFRGRSTPDGRCYLRSHVTNVLSPVHAPVVTQLLLCALIIHRPLGLDWKKTRLHSGINLCTLRAPIFSSRPLSIIRSRVATSMTDLKMARDCLATVSEKRLSNPCIIARGQRLAPADISRRVVFRLELPWDKTCLLTTGQR